MVPYRGMELTFRVDGMTCNHCTTAVDEEVSAVPGVTEVDVDLATKLVRVRGERLDAPAVVAAVDEAGYEAVSA